MKICSRLLIFELSDYTLRIFFFLGGGGYDFGILLILLFLDRYFGVLDSRGGKIGVLAQKRLLLTTFHLHDHNKPRHRFFLYLSISIIDLPRSHKPHCLIRIIVQYAM